MRIVSGVKATDAFLENGYAKVPGMSSRFAAAICARLIAIQAKAGITGGLAEIGAFEGRFFIALMRAMRPADKGVAIDHFEWPDAQVLDRFKVNCARHGIAAKRFTAMKADSRQLWASDIVKAAGGPARFFHVDGEHTPEHLWSDLALAAECLDPRGVMVLDDMLHPGYPLLAITVQEFLAARPEFQVCCVIDREDIVGAAKFVICRKEHSGFYYKALSKAFKQYHWPMTADFREYQSMVLTPKPRLAKI